MASTYSTNLGIELIGTGDQAGAWGNTTNTNLGTLVEQAISGYVTQAVATGTDTVITIPNGATGIARNMYIELTGTGGTNTNLIVPANKKLYFIYNNSTGAVTVKVAGQTGVSVPNGVKMILVSNGTDIVQATSYVNGVSANITTLTATSANITTLTGTNFTATSLVVSNALGIAQGGTGSSLTPSNGQLLVGNGTGFTLNTLNGGPGVGITNAAGSITITATGTGFIGSVSATAPLQSTGTQSVVISIASSTGTGAVVLASGANFSAASANITTLTGTTVTYSGSGRVNSLGVGTAASGTAGEILATNNVTAYYSDARLKDFQGVIPDALQKVKSLNGYLYIENELAKSWGFDSGEQQVGVSAQEVQAVLPQVTAHAPFDRGVDGQSLSGQNYMTVRYDRLVPLLIEAIKELSAKVEALEGKK